ncbi:MAG: DUF2975 domain-containing protein [Pseudomonadota bacterium]|nr:DUF2975 domain-containing protein [Pseudomonadota bacterium]
MVTLLFSTNSKLQRLCNWGRTVTWTAFVAVAVFLGYVAFNPNELAAIAMLGLPALENTPTSTAQFWISIVAVLPALLFLFALWRVNEVFKLISLGEFLKPKCQSLLVQLGWLAIIGSLLDIICHTATVALLTSNNPPGKHQLNIGLSSGHITSVMLGIILFIFALLLREMAAIDEDNKGII